MSGEHALPGLGLYGFWTPTSDGWMASPTGMNIDWRILSAIGKLAVISRVASLPVSPANGDIYLLTAGGNIHNIVLRDNGTWIYLPAKEGWMAWIKDEDTRYIFDGSVWKRQYTNADIDAIFSSIVIDQPSMLLLDQRASGTLSTNVSAFAWRQTVLNTVVYNEITGASLVANQITLPAGTYEVEGDKDVMDTGTAVWRLMNLDDTVTLASGINTYQTGVGSGDNKITLNGKFTLAAPKLCEMQFRKSGNFSYYSTGKAASLGSPEVYTSVLFKKVQ